MVGRLRKPRGTTWDLRHEWTSKNTNRCDPNHCRLWNRNLGRGRRATHVVAQVLFYCRGRRSHCIYCMGPLFLANSNLSKVSNCTAVCCWNLEGNPAYSVGRSVKWKAPALKAAYLVIRQTSTTVDVRLITDESESRSTFGQVSSGSEPPTLDYLYLNEPMSSLRDRSPIHHGSASMKIVGRPASRLTGHYWTDRDTRGELDMKWHKKETADDFESSERLVSARR